MAQKQKRDWLGFFLHPLFSHYTFYASFEADKERAKKASSEEVILKHITGNYFVILHLLYIYFELILLMHAYRLKRTGCN